MSNKNVKNQTQKPKSVKKPVIQAKKAQAQNPSQGNPVIKKLNNYINSIDKRQLLIKNMPAVIMGIIAWQIAPRLTFFPFPSWVLGVLSAFGLKLLVYFKSKNAKKYRKDMEYGSARWGTAKDIKPFIDPDPKNNVILTKNESLTMNP